MYKTKMDFSDVSDSEMILTTKLVTKLSVAICNVADEGMAVLASNNFACNVTAFAKKSFHKINSINS